MTQARSACVLDCPDLCSLEVEVRDDRVVEIDGTEVNPLTDGFICSKVRKFARHMYGDERIQHPMVRAGAKGAGTFRRYSWDEALALASERMQRTLERTGGEAILPYCYGGSNGLLTQNTTDARLFRRLGASQLARTFCAAATGAASVGLYGNMPGVALPDYEHAQLIVLWGVNPSATGIHLVPIIARAQRNGARLIVVDPRRTPLAKQADLHVPVRPGADLPVALGIIDWLFTHGGADEAFLAQRATGVSTLRARAQQWPIARAAAEAGVDPSLLLRFAQMYRESSPAVIRCGWGLERNRNGGSAVAAVLALPAVAGKFGVRAGGYTMSNGGAWGINSDAAIAEPAPRTRTINMNKLGEALCDTDDPAIEVLFVYNCNPAATAPNQQKVLRGLARDDLFTVVFEQVRTDTARYADLVLPATTFLEHRELRSGYGALRIFDAPGVVPPVGEARSNYEVFAELCERMGVARPSDPVGAAQLSDALLASARGADQIRQSLSATGTAVPVCGEGPVQFIDVSPRTDDGKIHLGSVELDRQASTGLYGYRPDPATAAFPLALISPASAHTVSSTFGQLRRGQIPVELHPDDARERNLCDGASVRVYNDLGEVLCTARLNADLRPGVALMPKGMWSHHTRNGATSNSLAPDTLTDLGGGACYNDARVDVARYP